MAEPGARLGAFAVVPGHPERRISQWYVCSDAACSHRADALTVTGDGFRHAHVVGVPVTRDGWFVEPAGPDHFAISGSGGRRSLVDLTGHVTPIHVGGATGPLVGSEVPLHARTSGFLAVDPDSGRAHPLATPPGVVQLEQSPTGQLRALSLAAYSWSDDGGATWHDHPLHPEADNELPQLVPTASDSTHAVLMGSDGATLFPWGALLRSEDGTAWTSYDGPRDPIAYVDSPVVLPDGRLLVDIVAWSDQRAGAPAARPVGFYLSADGRAPVPVAMGTPFDASPRRAIMSVVDVVALDDSVTVYAQATDLSQLFSSRDGGRHWQRVRAR